MPNLGNTAPYGYTGKTGATVKSLAINTGNAVGYDYAGKTSAIVKSI